MTAIWVALASVLAAAFAALATWAVAKRQRSGRIDTTEAATLWEESQSIRKELREESGALRLRLAEAETKLAETLQKLAETNMKLLTAQNQAAELREQVWELRRLCGKTNADVEAVRREFRVIHSEQGPEADKA